MPNIAVMKSSNFLKKEDVESDPIVTISGVTQENVAKQGAPEEMRWCVHFHEMEKPMVCNSTNAQLIAKFVGSDETDDWTGHKIVLYHDPSVSYGGKLVGGIRVRAVPKAQQSSAPRPSSAPASGSAKQQLKNKFRSHPEFNGKLSPTAINAYLIQNFGAKLDDLNDEQAKDALADYDKIVESCLDDIPF